MPFRSENGNRFGSFCIFPIVSFIAPAAACFLIFSPRATALFSVLCLKIFSKRINGFYMSGCIMKNTAPRPFEIYGASALSLHKKQSSTYSKYACGCFLYAPSICIVYFKRLAEKPYFTVCAATENPQRLHPYKPSTSSLVRPVIRQISDSG